MTWLVGRDFDFYIDTSDSDYLTNYVDDYYEPSKKTYILDSLHGGEMLIAYSIFNAFEIE